MSCIKANVSRPTIISGRFTNASAVTLPSASGGNYFPSNLSVDNTTSPVFNAVVGTTASTTAIVWRTDVPGLQVPVDGQYAIKHWVDGASNASNILSWFSINTAPAWRGVSAISNGATASNVSANVSNLLMVAPLTSGSDSGVSGVVELAGGSIISPWNNYTSTSAISIPANKLVVTCTLIQQY